MKALELLIESYNQRLENVSKMINEDETGDNYKFLRLQTKQSCYRSAIPELERVLAELKKSESNCSILLVGESVCPKCGKPLVYDPKHDIWGCFRTECILG